MRVLVAAASKHGGTTEIAQAIGNALTEARLETEVRPIEQVTTLETYDAVILGSGVYMGRWLEPAKRFVERNGTALATRPVWLFSSGPLGDPPKPTTEPTDVLSLIETTHARDHRVFPGVMDKSTLGLGERTIVGMVRAPAGDYRPWEEIHAWALGIARDLGHQA